MRAARRRVGGRIPVVCGCGSSECRIWGDAVYIYTNVSVNINVNININVPVHTTIHPSIHHQPKYHFIYFNPTQPAKTRGPYSDPSPAKKSIHCAAPSRSGCDKQSASARHWVNTQGVRPGESCQNRVLTDAYFGGKIQAPWCSMVLGFVFTWDFLGKGGLGWEIEWWDSYV